LFMKKHPLIGVFFFVFKLTNLAVSPKSKNNGRTN